MGLTSRMSKILLMPEAGDLVVMRESGARYVLTAVDFDAGQAWFAKASPEPEGTYQPSADQLTQLGCATDVQLRDECARRGWRSALTEMTDDQLHAEWMRRHPNQRLTALSGVTDDQLRAECERRDFVMQRHVDYVELVDRVARLKDEIDQAKRVIHAAMRDCGAVKGDDPAKFMRLLAAERDEWKRRAEAAEAKQVADEICRLGEANYGARWTAYKSVNTRLDESGPGIAATKPDTAHYVDPLDLLCEDA